MPEPNDSSDTKKHFLDVQDAEIVHGPDVIADEVATALKDADRFGMPHVKPPLADALGKARRAGTAEAAADDEPADQDALSGKTADVEETAGSAERLQPGGAATPGSDPAG